MHIAKIKLPTEYATDAMKDNNHIIINNKLQFHILFLYKYIKIIMDLKLIQYNSDTKNILINEPTKTFYIKQSAIQPTNNFYVCLYIYQMH